MKKNVVQKKRILIPSTLTSPNYIAFLEQIKADILQAQLKAALSITTELTLLYWRIGKMLSEKIDVEAWGTKVIEQLAHDLGNLFPAMTGLSRANIYRMMAFYVAYPNCRTAVRQLDENSVLSIPWGHNILILEKIQAPKERLWYAQKTLENGWSRATLGMWIESDLYSRQGKAITNFKATLPALKSDLAEQTLKDPYNFSFLMIDEKAREREIELELTAHIQRFLLELGQGFAFIGRQYPITVGSKDFLIDMLFYHINLRCFIVIELKAEEFDASNLGQINLYLSAVDSQLRHEGDLPSIGLLLCKSKDNYVAEYALRDINKPIGISSYTTKLVESLPKELKGKLPSIKEIEAELEKAKSPQRMKIARPKTLKTATNKKPTKKVPSAKKKLVAAKVKKSKK